MMVWEEVVDKIDSGVLKYKLMSFTKRLCVSKRYIYIYRAIQLHLCIYVFVVGYCNMRSKIIQRVRVIERLGIWYDTG